MTDTGTRRRGIILGSGLAAVQAGTAFAQAPRASAEDPRTARANAGTVGVISGGIDGTYVRIAADLSAVLDDGDRLRVLPVLGKGSVQNIADIIALRGIDVGIVQSDVLAYVVQEKLFPGVTQAINYIAKLYDEEVHVLARPEVARLEDLAGKPVNMDVQGSGTAMTASLIFKSLGIAVRPAHAAQPDALRQLQDGTIAALVFVSGKPAGLFATLPEGTGLHFLTIPATPALLETYLPTQLPAAAYPRLVPADTAVDTLAVGSVMAAFAWKPGSERYGKVARFVAALSDRFALLQKPPRHPKWREVNLAAQLPGWTRFPAVAR